MGRGNGYCLLVHSSSTDVILCTLPPASAWAQYWSRLLFLGTSCLHPGCRAQTKEDPSQKWAD